MFYLLEKPKNITSFKFINEFRRKNSIQKIGHTGTLDPAASGLMLVATDQSTKLIQYLSNEIKGYNVTLKFGFETNTGDLDGEIINQEEISIDFDSFSKTLLSFKKSYWQLPPQFSAKKINGKRAYQYAYQNQKVELKKALVSIHKISNIEMPEQNVFKFDVLVSKGTYIRSLVTDIASVLKTKAVLTNLIRTQIGDLTKNDLGIIPYQKLFAFPCYELNSLQDFLNAKKVIINFENQTLMVYYQKVLVAFIEVKAKKISKRTILWNNVAKLKLSTHNKYQ